MALLSAMKGNGFRCVFLGTVVFLVGVATAVYLHWPALTSETTYRSDARQGIHWVAYHSDTFREDDLLLRLAAHNESPIQNALYYLGTFLVDAVWLGKVMSLLSYGLVALLFFLVGRYLHGLRVGFLYGLFFTLFPNSFVYYNGFYSQAWAIPICLACVVLLQKQRWRGVVLLMPFAAVAYPMSVVLVGLIVLVHVVLLWFRVDRGSALALFKSLFLGSALALALLLLKYAFPPAGIGGLTAGDVLRKMPEMYDGGLAPYLPIPSLASDLFHNLGHPFVIGSALVFLFVLGRKQMVWEHSWTSLLVASVVGYVLADLLFIQLYIPSRYTRYSLTVLLIIWHVRNWDQVLKLMKRPWQQGVALVLLLAVAGYAYKDTVVQGEDTMDRSKFAGISQVIRSLPSGALIAGHPWYTDDVPIQGRRSVLVNRKLAHPWYSDYYKEVKTRTRDTFRAMYATSPEAINYLHDKYGVTHFFVGKYYYKASTIHDRKLYADPYDGYIRKHYSMRGPYVLNDPPKESILYEDEKYMLVKLPLTEDAWRRKH